MKTFRISLILFLLFISAGSLSAFGIELLVNEKRVDTGAYAAQPLILEGRTYVPLRFVSDALGYQVEWLGESRQVLINNTDVPRNMIPANSGGELQILLNGRVMFFPLDYGRPFINDASLTMVPVRAIAESMSFAVSFQNNAVYISGGNKEPELIPVSNEEEVPPAISRDPFSWELSIMGEPLATREQLIAFTNDRIRAYRTSIPQNFNRPFIEIPDLIDYYLEIGREYGIRGDIAYLQAIKETNLFQFTGIVQPHQNNYAGIWATGTALTGNEPFNGVSPNYIRFEPGAHGVTFSSPRVGVEAQIQHLYAYATTAPLPAGKDLMTPRFKYVNRGCAPRWIDLGGRWAFPGYEPRWHSSLAEAMAAGKTYGHSILDDYLAKVLAY